MPPAVTRTVLRLLAMLLGTLAAMQAAQADTAAAWAALRKDPVVALMRHADAPGGTGDPANFRLDDCATQRNLSEQGRREARAVGEKLRSERARIAKVASSPWCRCKDTAELLELGPVHLDANFSNVVVLSERRGEITEAARRVVAAWKGPGSLLVVTHGANIQALVGGTNPAQGEIVVVKPGGEGGLREIGRLPLPR